MNKLFFVVMLAVIGCAGMREDLRTKRQAELRQRASFDLGCPAEQLQVTPLDEAASSHGGGTTGVRGCDKQATYVWDAYGTGWILNSNAKSGADGKAGAGAR